jgi:hypothetical protein
MQFAQEQGRFLAMATPFQVLGKDRRVQSILPLADLRSQAKEESKYHHLDATGRARGYVVKGDVLAVLKDGVVVHAPFDAWVEAWDTTRKGAECVILVVEHAWESGIKVVWQLQKSVLTRIPNNMWAAGAPISFHRSQESTVSRNTPAIGTSSKALKLLFARGVRLSLSTQAPGIICHQALPGLESLFLREDCSLERVEAARELTWGLCRSDRYPVVFQQNGRRAGIANILLQEENMPLSKAAAEVLVAHVGGRGRRGFEPSRGGCFEWTERKAMRYGGYDATRPLQNEVEDIALLQWQEILSLSGCALYRTHEEDTERGIWELALGKTC